MLVPVLLAAVVGQTPASAQILEVLPKRVLQGQRGLAFAPSPSGSRFAATMEDKTIRIIDAATSETVKVLEGHPVPAYGVAWSADGAYIASGDESARIFIWDTRTWKKVREMRTHQRGIQSLSFNYPRTLLVSTGKDDVVKVWDVPTGKELQSIPGKGLNFFGAKFKAKTNDFGVGFLGAGARFYSAPTGKVMGFLTGHDNQGVLALDFNAAGTLASTGGKDANGAIWDLKSGKRLNYLRGSGDWVVQTSFSPNGAFVATSSPDRTVRLFNARSYQQVVKLEDQSAVGSPLCFTSDGKYLVTVNFDDYIQVHSLKPVLAPAPQTTKVPVKKAPAKKTPAKKKSG